MKIAIAGKMGSGKSYLADLICQRYRQYGFGRSSFAKRLKELSSELFDMKTKDRGLLIEFATKMRSIDRTVWIRSMLRDSQDYPHVVVDDLRLHNEYETLKKEGWFLIKITVNETLRLNRIMTRYGSAKFESHVVHNDSITENDVVSMPDSAFDMVIDNSVSTSYDPLFHMIDHELASINV